MISELFEALSLPLCLLWTLCDNVALVDKVIDIKQPLAHAYAVAHFFMHGFEVTAEYAAPLVENRIFYPIVNAVTAVDSPARKGTFNQLLRPIVSLFYRDFYDDDDGVTEDMLVGFVIRLISDEKRLVRPMEPLLPSLTHLPPALREPLGKLLVHVTPFTCCD